MTSQSSLATASLGYPRPSKVPRLHTQQIEEETLVATIKRFIKAIKDYYGSEQAGDIAFLKFELMEIGANPKVVAQIQDLSNCAPQIDLDALRHLPVGTLGYAYAQHMQQNGIQPLAVSDDLQTEAQLHPFALRYTATHDVFHVLLGFDTTYAGEMGVVAFIIAQNYSKFLNWLQPVVTHLYPLIFWSQRQQIQANIRRGQALGKQATCLLVYLFEQDWQRSIQEVRAQLGLLANDPPEQINRDRLNSGMSDPRPETAIAA